MFDTSSSVEVSQETCYRSQRESIAESPIVAQVPSYFERRTIWMKGLALALLVCLSPIILVCMVLVRMTSSGPAILRQTRLGKNGKLFQVFKIRTMRSDAEKLSGPTLCQPGDSRITPVGKVLRALHLDELPQLVNVLRGEMCLVGPRPERPEIVKLNKLDTRVPGFAERLKVLPGVTGLAQINLPADLSPDCVIPKVQLDLEYISTANLNLDLRILLCTALRMLGVRHGHGVRLLGVNRKVELIGASSSVTAESRIQERNHRKHFCSTAVGSDSREGGYLDEVTAASSEYDTNGDDLLNDVLDTELDATSEYVPVTRRPR